MTLDVRRPLRPNDPDRPAREGELASLVTTGSGRRRRLTPGLVVRWLLLLLATVAFAYPLVWLVSASLKPKAQVFDNRLVPETVQWSNFVTVWDAGPVLQWLMNSGLVSLMAAATVTLSSALVAFGFAYFRFRLRGALFGLVLATMMLPGAVTMIPVYLIWNRLGFVDTQVPLWAGNLFGSAFYIFLMRQFFLGVPRELFEAARIDGCSNLGLFRRIALPLCRPALIIVFIFELQASWSDLMKPLIYLQTEEYYTMPRGLKQIVDSFALSGQYNWEIAMAATLVATVPMIIVFAFGQRYFLEGLATQAKQG
ncbi:carbohydrate ABC transporter permease [Terracoccus luteus]|jgi:multiple sugar transport system permease protein|uniref:Multiple sugar transport system permease protein n=1 Tax=Terracoccus luteus TaxID=53356 RepID=A0A839PUC7_9MICO|nr:carbohydrate ABC transporter permease [Terracoccus luteus]MBB2986799.1 multiple sugar transport system permease protein [Terracoccus luteus]MCP2172450.1 multiple sugar transport system permease protein [Terracoccus luteus]